MRKTSSWIVLSIVIAAASGSERSIAAQPVCGTKAPPHEIEAHEVFREALLGVVHMHFPELQLQPPRRRGPSATGRPPSFAEGMEWRQDKSRVTIAYWRLASIEDATKLLCWHREIIPVGMRLVEGFADEAYEAPPPYNTRGSGNLVYRRGPFVFSLSVTGADTSVPGPIINPAIDIARLFLAATNEVLAAESK